MRKSVSENGLNYSGKVSDVVLYDSEDNAKTIDVKTFGELYKFLYSLEGEKLFNESRRVNEWLGRTGDDYDDVFINGKLIGTEPDGTKWYVGEGESDRYNFNFYAVYEKPDGERDCGWEIGIPKDEYTTEKAYDVMGKLEANVLDFTDVIYGE